MGRDIVRMRGKNDSGEECVRMIRSLFSEKICTREVDATVLADIREGSVHVDWFRLSWEYKLDEVFIMAYEEKLQKTLLLAFQELSDELRAELNFKQLR